MIDPDILNTLFGVDVPDSYDSVVSLALLVIAFHAAEALFKRRLVRLIVNEFGDNTGNRILAKRVANRLTGILPSAGKKLPPRS